MALGSFPSGKTLTSKLEWFPDGKGHCLSITLVSPGLGFDFFFFFFLTGSFFPSPLRPYMQICKHSSLILSVDLSFPWGPRAQLACVPLLPCLL